MSIWNGKASQADGYTVIKNNGYNQDIKPGETVVFGYIAVKEKVIKIPNKFSFTNYYLITPTNYEINYKIDNQWDNGYIASISITNTSNAINEPSNNNILPGESVTFSFTVTDYKGESEPRYFGLLSSVTL